MGSGSGVAVVVGRDWEGGVDLSTVQVTNMAQLHCFVFENCRKSYFNSIQDADPYPRVFC